MDPVTLIIGTVGGLLFLLVGLFIGRQMMMPKSSESNHSISPQSQGKGVRTVFSKKGQVRKRPVSISETELWKREQAEAPLDPMPRGADNDF